MVKITNGKLTLTVTRGAYKELYQRHGFAILTEEGADFDSGVVTTHPTDEKPEEEDFSQEETDEGTFTDEVDPDAEYEEPDLSEIPLSEMGFGMLQDYAEQLGLDYGGIRSKKELRALIRNYLKG